MQVRTACLEGMGKIDLASRDLKLDDDDILVKTHQASICLADIPQ